MPELELLFFNPLLLKVTKLKMPSLKTLCAELFGKDDLYAVLGAEKSASATIL